jgi:hypothetical protein
MENLLELRLGSDGSDSVSIRIRSRSFNLRERLVNACRMEFCLGSFDPALRLCADASMMPETYARRGS